MVIQDNPDQGLVITPKFQMLGNVIPVYAQASLRK